MVNRLLLLKIFEGFSIQRWNDMVRPVELTEMDKSALKMVIAYLLGKFEEKSGVKVDWEKIIYAGFFELLKKIVLSDIKASVHKKIKNEYPSEFEKLNNWVVDQYEVIIDDKELLEKFRTYLTEKGDLSDVNFKILRAAHKYSTMREFELIKLINNSSSRLFCIEKELNSNIEQFLDLKGMQKLVTKQDLYELLGIIEQLRFQIRWGQTQRIPKTTVLGHSMLVACFNLLLSREIKASSKRVYNNFFSGLFHDLPEAVTRDIISPVKTATTGLPDIVKKIEKSIVNEDLYPLVDDSFLDEIKYFTENEYSNRVIVEGKIMEVSSSDINEKYNSDEFSPVDGEMTKFSDDLSAFLEAYQSKNYGINSIHLNKGRNKILNKYKNTKYICGVDIRKLFEEFDD